MGSTWGSTGEDDEDGDDIWGDDRRLSEFDDGTWDDSGSMDGPHFTLT